MKPQKVNILGKEYTIIYCDKPSDVDVYKRESLWGQYDPWTLTIRVYDDGLREDAIFQTVLHEILHAIIIDLHITSVSKASDYEEIVDLIALAFADVFERNNWLKRD